MDAGSRMGQGDICYVAFLNSPQHPYQRENKTGSTFLQVFDFVSNSRWSECPKGILFFLLPSEEEEYLFSCLDGPRRHTLIKLFNVSAHPTCECLLFSVVT